MIRNLFLSVFGALIWPSINANAVFRLNPSKPSRLINPFAPGGILEVFNSYFGAAHHLVAVSKNTKHSCDNIKDFVPSAIINSPPKINQ